MADGVAAAGIPRERITTIPNSCDIANFAVSPSAVAAFRRERLPDLADGQPLIVYGGTYGKVNDAGWLVDVAAAMRSTAPQIAFAMAGTGAEEDAIRQRARASGVLGRSLWILPALPKRDVPAFLGCAAVATSLVSPVRELWNNSANKFFDALAAGKPIAINHEGWQADLLRQTGAGIVVPHGDPAAAAHRLAALAGSEEARQRASAAARRLARESFDRDKLAVQLEAVLARAVRLHRSPVAEVVGLA
jgi:glycosyltransferase involved in cell wall biosynthesis